MAPRKLSSGRTPRVGVNSSARPTTAWRSPPGMRAVTEFEDRGADLGNGGVEVVHHLVDPFSHEIELGEACGPLQGHTDGEQALHDPVMEVTPNPLSVVEHADRPDTVVQAGVVDRDARCQSEGFGEGFILVGEAIGSDLVCEIQVAEDLTFRPDGHTEEGLHGRMIRREPDNCVHACRVPRNRSGAGSVIKSPRTPRPVGRDPMACSADSLSPTVKNCSRPVRASLSTPRAP